MQPTPRRQTPPTRQHSPPQAITRVVTRAGTPPRGARFAPSALRLTHEGHFPQGGIVRWCSECGKAFTHTHVLQRLCSKKCQNLSREKSRGGACVSCGKWVHKGRLSAEATICQPCRRTRPGYRPPTYVAPVHEWVCGGCGKECSRPATRGQKPKWCESCRKALQNRDIKITPAQRVGVYVRDGWSCWLCEGAVDRTLIGSYSHWRPSLDHVVPRSMGGSDDPENLRLAHWWCNSVRSDGRAYSPEDFRVAS
ncbi:HNH endonuclease [Microbacterium testaceum]|uniref:HNH endonuclease n=1 Tax=Microbacterium testaceum TaxID=2033 RepID=UPI0009C11B5B